MTCPNFENVDFYLSCHEPAILDDDMMSSFEKMWHGEGATVSGLRGVEGRCEEQMFKLGQMSSRGGRTSTRWRT